MIGLNPSSMASGFIDTNIVGTKMTDVDPCMFTVLYR
jgi:hypothetical protein